MKIILMSLAIAGLLITGDVIRDETKILDYRLELYKWTYW